MNEQPTIDEWAGVKEEPKKILFREVVGLIRHYEYLPLTAGLMNEVRERIIQLFNCYMPKPTSGYEYPGVEVLGGTRVWDISRFGRQYAQNYTLDFEGGTKLEIYYDEWEGWVGKWETERVIEYGGVPSWS